MSRKVHNIPQLSLAGPIYMAKVVVVWTPALDPTHGLLGTHMFLKGSLCRGWGVNRRGMSVHVPVSQNSIMKLSIAAITSCGMSFGAEDSFNKACVSSGNTAHTVFFPWPRKLDTVSQPINAWDIGSACAFSEPSPAASSWAARNQKFFAVSHQGAMA